MRTRRTENHPLCLGHRSACTAYSGGYFRALTDTWFGKNGKKPCPFYKTKGMVTAHLKEAANG